MMPFLAFRLCFVKQVLFYQSAQNRAVMKSGSEEEIIWFEHSEDNRMFGRVCLSGAKSLEEYSGLSLHACSIHVLYSVSLLAVVRSQVLGLVDLWSNKCNCFNVRERLAVSKEPCFRQVTILHIDSYYVISSTNL